MTTSERGLEAEVRAHQAALAEEDPNAPQITNVGDPAMHTTLTFTNKSD